MPERTGVLVIGEDVPVSVLVLVPPVVVVVVVLARLVDAEDDVKTREVVLADAVELAVEGVAVGITVVGVLVLWVRSVTVLELVVEPMPAAPVEIEDEFKTVVAVAAGAV